MAFTELILVTTGVASGVTSIPLTYLAVRNHRHQRRLHAAQLELHRLISHRPAELAESRRWRPS